MRKALFIILVLFSCKTLVFGQNNEINTTIYAIKHDKEDSVYLSQHPNHSNYILQLVRIEPGSKKDTAIFIINNLASEALNRLYYNVYSQSLMIFSEPLKIDKIVPISKYLLKIPVAKDSSFTLVLSDYSNSARISPFSTISGKYSYKAELKSIIIDDSSTVRNRGKHPFKINSMLEQGESVKLVFVLNTNTLKNINTKAYLTTSNQDVYIKNKDFSIDSVNLNGDFNVEFEISTSLTTDKLFPLLLRITDGKNDYYNKEIFIDYNKEYKMNENSIIRNTNGSSESLKAVFKNNVIKLQLDLPEISWNNEYQLSYSIGDIKNNKTIYSKTTLKTANKAEEAIFGFPIKNGSYNLFASVVKHNIIPKHSYLTLNITPSSTSENIVLNNFKWGLRFLRVKEFGYYIEFNSTLNSNNHDYSYDVFSKKVEGFDDYNKFYEFLPEYSVISRDAGAGLAYRLGKKIILSAGLSYYTYEFKQQIKEFEYADISKYSIKNVLIPSYAYNRVINKLSVNYNLNNILLGLTISDYNKNNYRVSFNMGVKI